MSRARIPIVIDTSEPVHTAWEFDADTFEVERRSLDSGDYSIKDLEAAITVERKTLGDCVSTVIHNWMRFRKLLYRMAGMDHAIVIIECNLSDIYEGLYESEAIPAAVVGRIISIIVDHNIAPIFASNRQYAEMFAAQFLVQVNNKTKR